MRYLFVLSLFVLPLFSFAQSRSDRAVLETEQRRFDAMTRRDTIALHTMLSDRMMYIHSNALTENKAQHIGAIASGRMVYQTMVRERADVRHFGKTALTNGIVQVRGIVNGTPFEVRLVYTAVYRKKRGHWLLLNWQSTRTA